MSAAEHDVVTLERDGMLLAGRYQLVRLVAAGSTCSFWLGRHVDLGHPVVVKLLRMAAVQSGEWRARFAREAALAATLGSRCERICRVIDYGVVSDDDSLLSVPFMVMEHLEGETVAEYLRRCERMPVPLALRVTLQLLRGLEAVHAARVVHRNIKPSNVFLGRNADGSLCVKLLDFGVALSLDGQNARTEGHLIVGTPAYMSPEQFDGAGVDPRSDLWAVAALFYRMVTGRLPFGGGSIAQVARRLAQDALRPPGSLVAGLSAGVESWVVRGLEKDPAERFASVAEMMSALRLAMALPSTSDLPSLLEEATVIRPPSSELLRSSRGEDEVPDGERTTQLPQPRLEELRRTGPETARRADATEAPPPMLLALSRRPTVMSVAKRAKQRSRRAALFALMIFSITAGCVAWIASREASRRSELAGPAPDAEQ
jgi:serine/threonine-protein kinase